MKALVKIWKAAGAIEKLAIAAAVVIVLILLYALLKKALKKDPTQTAVNNASDELAALATAGQVPHYSAAQFSTFSDQLEQAMSGLGTDEESIKSTMAYMQNRADVLQLIKSFGIRDYTDDKILIYNIKPFNLNQWLSAELDAADMETYVNAILKQHSIDYIF